MFAMIDDKTIILLFLCYLSNANFDFISTFLFFFEDIWISLPT